jgi:hypothetical protein
LLIGLWKLFVFVSLYLKFIKLGLYQCFNGFGQAFMQLNVAPFIALCVTAFPGVKMVLSAFSDNNLILLGNFKSFGGSFVRLYFRHKFIVYSQRFARCLLNEKTGNT